FYAAKVIHLTGLIQVPRPDHGGGYTMTQGRSEERRVGKKGTPAGSAYASTAPRSATPRTVPRRRSTRPRVPSCGARSSSPSAAWRRLGSPPSPIVANSRSFFFQAEDGIRGFHVTGVQTCALPIYFYAAKVIHLTGLIQVPRPDHGGGYTMTQG